MTDPPPDVDTAAHSNDAFFKSVFSEPHRAVAFFKSHWPATVAADIDWDSLEVVPSSFVKASLRQVHSDLLFSVVVKGWPMLLYLLFEHQSTPDPAIRLRQMLLYALHADSDLDTEKIHATLKANPALERKAMSVAEKLIKQGLSQGLSQGFWVGRIQSLEEFLEQPVSSRELLERLPLAELEALHAELHRQYGVRFKGR